MENRGVLMTHIELEKGKFFLRKSLQKIDILFSVFIWKIDFSKKYDRLSIF